MLTGQMTPLREKCYLFIYVAVISSLETFHATVQYSTSESSLNFCLSLRQFVHASQGLPIYTNVLPTWFDKSMCKYDV